MSQFGSAGAGISQFGWLAGIAIDPDGNLWLTDAGNARVQEWTS